MASWASSFFSTAFFLSKPIFMAIFLWKYERLSPDFVIFFFSFFFFFGQAFIYIPFNERIRIKSQLQSKWLTRIEHHFLKKLSPYFLRSLSELFPSIGESIGGKTYDFSGNRSAARSILIDFRRINLHLYEWMEPHLKNDTGCSIWKLSKLNIHKRPYSSAGLHSPFQYYWNHESQRCG